MQAACIHACTLFAFALGFFIWKCLFASYDLPRGDVFSRRESPMRQGARLWRLFCRAILRFWPGEIRGPTCVPQLTVNPVNLFRKRRQLFRSMRTQCVGVQRDQVCSGHRHRHRRAVECKPIQSPPPHLSLFSLF